MENKKIIYIDFEAMSLPIYKVISQNTKEELKLPINFLPMAYTIGAFNDKNEFITKTEIADYEIDIKFRINLKNKLLDSIKSIFPKISIKEIEFSAFEKNMEYEFLKYIFGDEEIVVHEFYEQEKLFYNNNDIKISIKNITSNFNNIEYFSYLKEKINNHKKSTKLKKHIAGKDGMAANYVCFLIFMRNNKKKIKIEKRYFAQLIDADHKKLLNELIEYSKDDVLRMKYIKENSEEIQEVIRLHFKYRDEKQKVDNKYKFYFNLFNNLNTLAKNIISEEKKENSKNIFYNIEQIQKMIKDNYLSEKEKEINILEEELKENIKKLKRANKNE